jgi:hypothetical protein
MTLLRRLKDLEKAIKFRHPRMIVVKIATDAATGKHTADGEAALAALKQQHAVTDDDLLVVIADYSDGGEQSQLVSITQQ